MNLRTFQRIALFAVLGLCLGQAAYAQNWPERPIRLIVPFPTGGATDIVGRVIAQQASVELGQSIVIDNKTGAGGTIGTAEAVRSKPDGYTLLMSTNSTQAIAPHLYSQLPYKSQDDLTPIAHLGDAASILLINPSIPVDSLQELVSYGKSRPVQLNYASSGTGTIVHLNTELFMHQTGLELSHVPYRGTGQAITDMISGNVHVLIDAIPSGLPYVRSGQLKALATTGRTRTALTPDLPTFIEAGLPEYESLAWFGLYAPKGVPQDIVNKVYDAFQKSIHHPSVRKQLEALGVDLPRSNSTQEFIDLVKLDSDRWKGVIQQANVPIQ